MKAIYAVGEQGARVAAREGAAVVVVDAFRASTTIAVLVSKGVRVVPVASIEEAASYPGAAYRIRERGSAKVHGFDFGNSPAEIEKAELEKGATVVLSTTNGTRIIEAARDAPAILMGAFVNAHAIADELTCGIYGASQGRSGAAGRAVGPPRTSPPPEQSSIACGRRVRSSTGGRSASWSCTS